MIERPDDSPEAEGSHGSQQPSGHPPQTGGPQPYSPYPPYPQGGGQQPYSPYPPYPQGGGQQPYSPYPPQAGGQHSYATGPPGAAGADPGKFAGWLMVAASTVAVLGSVLPWARVSFVTVNGTDGDGSVTLVLALVAVGFGVARALSRIARAAAIVGIVMGALITLIAVVDMAQISSLSNQTIVVSLGIGIFLVLLAGLGLIGASIVALVRRSPRR